MPNELKFLDVFDPLIPAEKEYYVDCADVRGGERLAQIIRTRIDGSSEPKHALFTGHTGSGKSSELRHLADTLKSPMGESKVCHFPIYLDMDEMLDQQDVDIRDILFAVVAQVGEVFRTELKIELKQGYFAKRLQEIKEALFKDVSVDKVELGDKPLKFILQFLQSRPETRKEVRKNLFAQPDSLREHVNDVLDEATARLKKANVYNDICLIVDSLEKVERLDSDLAGAGVAEQLFIGNKDYLRGLRVDTVWTVPLDLVRTKGGELTEIYGQTTQVMQMIKVRRRDRSLHEPGIEKMREIVRVRLNGKPIESVISADHLDRLIDLSGGHIRLLMQLLSGAAEYSSLVVPFSEKSVKQSIARHKSEFFRVLYDEDYQLLAQLSKSRVKNWDTSSPERLRLLTQRCVMEYINGDDGDPENATPWFAVNPIVRELEGYQELDPDRAQ